MRTRSALLLAIAVLATNPPMAYAAAGNEFAVGYIVAGSAIYDGMKGFAEIRTDPATVVNVAYVHPTQMDIGASGGDFVGIGTVNGASADTFCLDNYDAKWDIYVDYQIGGIYTCRDIVTNAYSAPSTQSFQITWSFCESQQANRWVLTWASVDRWCVNSASHSAIMEVAGLETASDPFDSTDRNIDVKYTGVQYNLTGSGTWANWSPTGDPDLNYTYQKVGTGASGAFNVYLNPLN